MRRGANSCFKWTGKSFSLGYGMWKGVGAHRVMYAMKNGPIPDGAVVRHKCDNPPCCNPAHLEIGTHADNRADCVARNRHSKGETNGKAKLTARQVGRIRTYFKGWTHAQIAEKYGVSRSVITRILNGSSWAGK